MDEVVHTGPPGWPRSVPPPGVHDWQNRATLWMLDHCPAEFRSYGAWRRHPIALAWITHRHIDAQLAAMREAYRLVRVELAPQLPPATLPEVMEHLELEGLRLRSAATGVRLIEDALAGKHFVPRL